MTNFAIQILKTVVLYFSYNSLIKYMISAVQFSDISY